MKTEKRSLLGPDTQGGLLFVLAAMGLRLSLTDAFARFVRPGMRWPLILASLFVGYLGFATIRRAWKSPGDDHAGHDHAGHDHGDGDDDDCGHEHRPTVAWLLALPVAVILVVAPASLGAFAADRSVQRTTQLSEAEGVNLGALPGPNPATGLVELSLTDYSNFALFDVNQRLEGVKVKLVGFVASSDEAPGGYYLARFTIACCAADAFVAKVGMHGDLPALADDTWIAVEGVWRPTPQTAEGTRRFIAEIDVTNVTEVPIPDEPYEI